MAIGNSIFSGRICDAAYTNPEHDTVEVLYRQVHPDEPSGTDAEIKNESSFVNDLGADSLDTVELVMALEEEFDCEIPDEEAEKITTVQLAIDYINTNLK